jgi:hypothetical protein
LKFKGLAAAWGMFDQEPEAYSLSEEMMQKYN